MSFFTDLRFAVRVLLKKPLFTLMVIVTLALGLGAGSAMFSITDALLLRPVDFPELDRLVAIQERGPRGEYDNEVSPRGFFEYRGEAKSFSDVAAYQYWDVALTGHGDPQETLAFQVSPGFFEMLQVKPQVGRWFAADEVDGKNEKVAILSHGLWQRRYGGDASIVGQTVTIDRESYVVVGVMPKDFYFPMAAEIWAPLTLTPEQRQDRAGRYLGIVAKLKPGVSLASADAEMRAMGERDATLYKVHEHRALRVQSLPRSMSEDFTVTFILMLVGAAIFVLLISCANVANLFLAHTLARRKELAVRAALGAGRRRIVRQLLTEAAVLGVTGGLLSLLGASWALDAIKAAIPATTTRFIGGWENMGVDTRVLFFTVGLGLLVGLIFGVMPAFQVSRTDVNLVLKDGDRGTTASRRTHRLRAGLVVVQIALALILLLGAGALSKGFLRIANQGRGIAIKSVLTLRVNLPETRYQDKDVAEFQRAVLERMRALPGVEAAGAVNNIPWGNYGGSRAAFAEGRTTRPEDAVEVDYRPATPSYLEALRIPRLQGRGLEQGDGPDSPRVAVISATAARRLWPDGQAIGHRLRFSLDDKNPWITVVGIAGDVADRTDQRGPRAAVYLPFAQNPSHGMYFALRTTGSPLDLAHAAAQTVFAVDPSEPVSQVRSLELALSERISGIRIGSFMMVAFAVLALILAAVGIYGVVATLVTQRTHEIGVRMALGAQRRDVLRLVLGKGAALTATGVAIGLILGFFLVRFLSGIMFGIVEKDFIVFVIFTSAVTFIALFGSFVPAWRASRTDPLVALRHD